MSSTVHIIQTKPIIYIAHFQSSTDTISWDEKGTDWVRGEVNVILLRVTSAISPGHPPPTPNQFHPSYGV